MKNLFQLSMLVLLIGLSMQEQAMACLVTSASISGPEGRCAVAPGVATTYTGTHNFSSSGCTIYEWTVTGGTITGPAGTSVTNGTLCIAENGFCFAELSFDCDLAEVDLSVASGNGASVTVVWDPGVRGTLKLKAREVGSKTLHASDEIAVDNILYPPSYITKNLNGSSGTYTAQFNEGQAPCSFMQVRWTVNGSFAGTGNPKSLGIGFCESGIICATVVSGELSSAERCTSVNGDVFAGEISGPGNATAGVSVQYTIQSNIALTSIQWYGVPAWAPIIFSPNSATTGVVFPGPPVGSVSLCVDITNACGDDYTICKNISVSGGDNSTSPNDPKSGVDDHLVASKAAQGSFKTDAMNVQPTLIDQQQDLQVELPQLDATATLSIIDLSGRVVRQQKANDQFVQISSEGLQAGMYFLVGQNNNWRSTQKFVVK